MTLAIIKAAGKQYLVKAGDKLKVDKLPGKEGDKVKLDTLLITDEKGSSIEIGKPTLKSKTEATIVKQIVDKKIDVVKYKAKTRYKKVTGHRQQYSQIQIDKI